MAAPSNASWSDYDHLQVSALEEPMAVLHELRKTCPVGHSDKFGGFYVLTRYEDCVAAALDPRFSSALENGPGPGFPFSFHSLLRMPMITDDGQRHRDFKMPLQLMFSPKFAASLEPRIREICDALIDGFIKTGEADLADQYSIELPAVLIAELLDLPFERRREFQHWACELVATGDMALMEKLADYTAELYEARRAAPGDDIPSKLLGLQIEGRPITAEEWRGLILLLVLGGLDTTANGGGYIFHMLGRRPALRRRLIDNPELIASVIPEFVRLISPVPQHSRGVTADVEIGGHLFRPGDVVQLNWLAANHDPAAFANPDAFDPERSFTRHVGFGHGPHICLGRHLALVELRVMVERVLARIPDYELVEGGVERFPSLNRGMNHLRVTFPAPPSASRRR